MKITYDFHIHSSLSPCADNNMTPADIAGIGALNGLSAMALTDHNSCENCPAFFDACKFYGIVPIAGMELTTAEDIHLVCLFKSLDDAIGFSDEVYNRLLPINNKPEIFGDQIVLDSDGNEIKRIERLLISATDISIEDAPAVVKSFGGICYPAHIDRESNGIIAILGDIPPEPGFNVAEFNDIGNLEEYKANYSSVERMKIILSSDAHSLLAINTDINSFNISDELSESIVSRIFSYLSEV